MSKGSRETQGKKSKKIIIIRVIAVILGLFLGIGLYCYKILSGFRYVAMEPVSEEDYELVTLNESGSFTGGDITSSWKEGGHTRVFVDPKHPIIKKEQIDPNVENILVFGIDARDVNDYKSRSDCMMVVSLDKKNDKVKLTSLMRDMGVHIGDTKENQDSKLDKLNHAYHYGGVGLMINTINNNFDLDIQRFAMFDFSSAANIIDLCGGVEIEVKPEEVKYANMAIVEQNQCTGANVPLISSGGKQLLKGTQAIGWSRIRKLDTDAMRTSRQRTVATELIKKVSSMSKLSQAALLDKSSGNFEMNMKNGDLMRIGLVAAQGAGNIEQYCIPEEGMYKVQPNPWMMIINYDELLPKLRKFIWG